MHCFLPITTLKEPEYSNVYQRRARRLQRRAGLIQNKVWQNLKWGERESSMLFVSHLCRISSIRALVLSRAVFLDVHLSIVVDVAWWSHTVLAFHVFHARTSHPLLISIFPPVCRNIAKQTFLETLQDNLIEMDILASARHDAAYSDGYVACLLSGSQCRYDLLCCENNVMPASFLHPNDLCLKHHQSSVCVSASPRISSVSVPALFNATNNCMSQCRIPLRLMLNTVTLWIVVTLVVSYCKNSICQRFVLIATV